MNFRGSWSGYERDCQFHNPDGPCPRFYNTAYLMGLDFDDDGRSVAPVDIDGDGDMDLVCLSLQGLRVMENVLPTRNFARLRLKATRTNALALNAMVKVSAGGVTQQDYVKITDGFQTQVLPEMHFGLGSAAKIDRILVRWPTGESTEYTDLPANRMIEIVEDAAEAPQISELPHWPEATRPKAASEFKLDLALDRLEGGQGPLAKTGTPAVVNFWSPTCGPCKEELPQLAALAKSFGDRVQFAGVSAEAKDLDSVKAAVAAFALPYPQFLANENFKKSYFGAESQAILPSTFVFDATGHLQRVFHRAISASELTALLDSFRNREVSAADLEARGLASLNSNRLQEAAEWLRKAVAADPLRASSHNSLSVACSGLAEKIEEGTSPATTQEESSRRSREALPRREEAIAHLNRAVELEPDYGEAWYNLGVSLGKVGSNDAAVPALQNAIKFQGESYDALYALGMAAGGAKQNALAGETFERAIALDPKKADAWVGKALWLRQVGRASEAKKCLERALEMEPSNAQARAILDSMK